MPTRLLTLLSLVLMTTAAATQVAYADEDEGKAQEQQPETEQVYEAVAVQNRMYDATAEITAYAGVLPMDAFTKGLTLSGSYTHHFSQTLAWEILHGYYSFHADTSLKDDLDALTIEPTPFEVLDYFFTTNLVLKPIYWKGALLNESLVHGEILILVGGGYGSFTRSSRGAVDLGLAMRLYASQAFSFRVDVRHHVFFRDTIFSDLDLQHELWTGLGVSLAL